MNRYLENSVFLRKLGDLKQVYLTMEEKRISVYLNSFSYCLFRKIVAAIKIGFKYSFLGRVTEIREPNAVVLDNSRVARYSIDFYKRWKDEIIHYSKTSSTISLAKDTKEELIFSLVRMISSIIIITILVNAILFVILQKQMGLWSFLIRVLFLFVGTAGLSYEADWSMVKKSSIFLRKMRVY